MGKPTKPKTRKWGRRRQYVIDQPVQMGVAGQLLAGLGGVAMLCMVALFVFLSGMALPGMDPLKRFLILTNATYFVLAGGILVMMTILITHRFAGPAYVMRIAVRGMIRGDFAKRLNLRKKDYLKELAKEFAGLREHWFAHEQQQRTLLDELEVAIRAGDRAEAKRLVSRLRDGLIIDPDKTPPGVEIEGETSKSETPEVEKAPKVPSGV